MDNRKPMFATVGLDDVTLSCPCGESFCGEGESVAVWKSHHKQHTNGKCVEIITASGQSVFHGGMPGRREYAL
jgi:hypothetical protein